MIYDSTALVNECTEVKNEIKLNLKEADNALKKKFFPNPKITSYDYTRRIKRKDKVQKEREKIYDNYEYLKEIKACTKAHQDENDRDWRRKVGIDLKL